MGMVGLVAAVAVGFSGGRAAADDEADVRRRFAELQAALKARDADKIWPQLAEKSRADAEREARKTREAYAAAGQEERAKRETALGLTGAEISRLTGKDVLRTKPFRRKFDEVPDGKVEKVTLEKDSATVQFLEPDGDHEKVILLREGDGWKAWLIIPRVSQATDAPPGRDRP
jgi:hypothetical protein